MKKMFSTVFILLRKFNRLWIVSLALFVALISVFTALLLNVTALNCIAIFLFLMCAWEISDVFLFEKKAIVEDELADTKDKLILADHEVERLKSELEALKTELAKARETQAVQTELVQVESSDAESTEMPGQVPTQSKPRPKRRPVPKRKPKTEKLDENKD